MHVRCFSLLLLSALVLAPQPHALQVGANLLPDPSVEDVRPKNQFGVPFAKWGGWIFEGACEFRNGAVARSGRTSAEMVGGQGGKIRLYSPTVSVEPGRYRFSCYVRGLDIAGGEDGVCEDINFADDQYYPLKTTGSFGWSRLEIVKDMPARKEVKAAIGLWGAGRLWVDDAELVRVPDSTPLTVTPALGPEERPIESPGPLDPAVAIRCPDCGYRNMPAWGRCYACGSSLVGAGQDHAASGPTTKMLADFAEGTIRPFGASEAGGASVSRDHAPAGGYSLRLDRGYVAWDGPQNWTGYDFIQADIFNAGDEPRQLYVEIHDTATSDYWTRVNYTTVLPPGASTLVVPTDIYVGEKSRPGRPLDPAHVNKLVLNVGDGHAPVYVARLRLQRDLSDRIPVPGLMAFSFGPGNVRTMPGFIPVSPSTLYSPGRGYGLDHARIWRAYDALQPDPLYEQGICIEGGGFRVDLPNGRYHVFLNLDSPSGFWGEYQVYRERVVRANGAEVVHDTMDLASFTRKYYRFADVEDRPEENTFDKYQRAYFHEHEFDVEVVGGRLDFRFQGGNWANFVSALIIYPAAQTDTGRQYLLNLRERRRFYFDNYFKRVLPNGSRDAKGAIPPFQPTALEQKRGYVVWSRDWMEDVPVNGVPRREEVTRELSTFASAGQLEPIVFSITPLRGHAATTVAVNPTDLTGPGGARVPASAIRPGVVSHRITRVTPEGTVYTIAPRFILPRDRAELRDGATTTFWLTLHTPHELRAGTYRGAIALAFAHGRRETLGLSVRLFATPLDALDVPAGPWGCTIDLPWISDQPAVAARNWETFRRCLAKMREYGLTACSGVPTLRIRGWRDGRPDIDFERADREMAEARAAGMKLVVNYNGGIGGFDNYHVDAGAMKSAGSGSYTQFLHAVLAAIDAHARTANWLPVAYNLCDEPIGDEIGRATENARTWREALPADMLTTGATSVEGAKAGDPHLALATALRVANLNLHDEATVRAIHVAGGDWAFYNGGSRWTYGIYMYKCAREYGMKFRLSWHWNAAAGDPFYALDCREDDYAWCVTNARGDLIPAIAFDREIRAGVDDYRYMTTLSRLLRSHPHSPAAPAARRLLADKLAAFKLGDRDHDARWPVSDYRRYRLALAEAIERLAR